MAGRKKRDASPKTDKASTKPLRKQRTNARQKIETEVIPSKQRRRNAVTVKPKGVPTYQNHRTPAQRQRAKDTFLAELAITCHIGMAAQKAGISRSVLHDWRSKDPEFNRQWEDILENAVDDLEREARRRGLEGFEKPIVYQGMVTGSYKEYSDRLLELLLKGRRAKVFAPRVETTPPESPEQFAQRLQQALQKMLSMDNTQEQSDVSVEGSYEND